MEQEEEGEETGVEDQEDEEVSTVSLQKEVKDLSAKLSQVLGAVAKLTKQVNARGRLQLTKQVNAPRIGTVVSDEKLSPLTLPGADSAPNRRIRRKTVTTSAS